MVISVQICARDTRDLVKIHMAQAERVGRPRAGRDLNVEHRLALAPLLSRAAAAKPRRSSV